MTCTLAIDTIEDMDMDMVMNMDMDTGHWHAFSNNGRYEVDFSPKYYHKKWDIVYFASDLLKLRPSHDLK
jgi:hypothetical protein